tara:strand:+ start:275 stop:517 length:243 start_codon:yes stop_codon:yes gene_type:complete
MRNLVKFIIGSYAFLIIVLLSIIACEDVYIGKTKEEIATELSQAMFEVDSILMSIQYQLDTASVDGTYYLNMQRINNGHP